MIILKYTPDPTNPYDVVTVEMSGDPQTTPEVLEMMQTFLRALGYHIKELGDVGDE